MRIKYADLPEDRDGEYLHRKRLIRLQRGMATRLHNSVLAHECAHALFADVPSPYGRVNAKQERRADEWARVVSHPAVGVQAGGDHSRRPRRSDGGRVSRDWDLVEAFRRTLLVVGDRTYVRPRMGSGQWDHREVTR